MVTEISTLCLEIRHSMKYSTGYFKYFMRGTKNEKLFKERKIEQGIK